MGIKMTECVLDYRGWFLLRKATVPALHKEVTAMQPTTDFAILADLAARLPQSSVAGRSSVGGLAGRRRSAPADEPRRDEASALAEQAQAGDVQALRPLLEQVRPRALAIALKVLRNRDDAEDAVQDAMLKVWRNLHRFEGRASFTTWIHRIVMNASLDILRKRSARAEGTSADEHGDDCQPKLEPSHDQTPEREMSSAEMQILVRTAVARLTPVHRQAIILREFEDCAYDEIAEAEACPIGTVMSRLHHARQRVAEELRAAADFDVELWAA
jgi:RNA polymerase sigma-70 factor (ECF subfamily)